MKTYLSFWHVCLDNLPVGRFKRRTLAAAAAGALIKAARANQTLRCVTQDDLVAPYQARKRQQQESLCAVLRTAYDIEIGIDDFLCDMGENGSPLYSIAPLQLVHVRAADRLLIVGCHYGFEPGLGNPADRSIIAEDSVTFDLIEALPSPSSSLDRR